MILTGLLIGVALGFAMQRGRFCVTGAFRDVWIGGKTRWLTAFLIVIAVQSVGIFALDALGVITLGAGELAPVATIVGAFIFGFAIVLAGGCATGTFYRSGEGLVGSWFALLFYAGFSAIMEYGVLADVTEAARARTIPATTIHESLGISPWWLVGILVAAVGYATYRHLSVEPQVRLATLPPRRRGLARVLFEKPWHAFSTAVVIGVIATVAWPLSTLAGRPAGLGITTPSANLVTYLVTGDAELVDWGSSSSSASCWARSSRPRARASSGCGCPTPPPWSARSPAGRSWASAPRWPAAAPSATPWSTPRSSPTRGGCPSAS